MEVQDTWVLGSRACHPDGSVSTAAGTGACLTQRRFFSRADAELRVGVCTLPAPPRAGTADTLQSLGIHRKLPPGPARLFALSQGELFRQL